MNTQPNLDRIVDEAIVLADLTGPQTGTAPTPRVPRYEAPADQPPVDFVGEEDDRAPKTPIQRLFRLRQLTQAALDVVNDIVDEDLILATDSEEIEMAALMPALGAFEGTIMSLPATCWADVQTKLDLWAGLIAGPACIHPEDHIPAFVVLRTDIERLAGRVA